MNKQHVAFIALILMVLSTFSFSNPTYNTQSLKAEEQSLYEMSKDLRYEKRIAFQDAVKGFKEITTLELMYAGYNNKEIQHFIHQKLNNKTVDEILALTQKIRTHRTL